MKIFLDTEFASLQAPTLLSIGLVAEDGKECYAEIARGRAPVSGFVVAMVISQWGLVPWRVASQPELGRRVGAWLLALGAARIEVVHDYPADFELLEGALLAAGLWALWSPRLVPCRVGLLARQPGSGQAMDLSWAASYHADGIRRHHALADARALRAGYQTIHPRQIPLGRTDPTLPQGAQLPASAEQPPRRSRSG